MVMVACFNHPVCAFCMLTLLHETMLLRYVQSLLLHVGFALRIKMMVAELLLLYRNGNGICFEGTLMEILLYQPNTAWLSFNSWWC